MKLIVVDGKTAVVLIPKTTPEEFQARVQREQARLTYHEPPWRMVNQKGQVAHA